MAPDPIPEGSEKASQDPAIPSSHATEPIDAPDPGEDDLDDLDDMLDEFSVGDNQPRPAPPNPALQTTENEGGKDDVDRLVENQADFVQQLQSGMEDLLGELQSSPEIQKHLEGLMEELGEHGIDTTAPDLPSKETQKGEGSKSSVNLDAEFQDTIRKTMERMQESGDQATAAASADEPGDLLGEMFKQLQGESLDGAGSEEDISKMIMGMMEQLTNKDILYEPMKELHDKFPAWLEAHKSSVDAADMERYKVQQSLVDEVVARFNSTGYSDDNAADRQFIVERMQKLQEAGSPPADLVGDMSAAQEALDGLDGGCNQQ